MKDFAGTGAMSQSASQASAFFEEAVHSQVVWTLRDRDGIPAPQNEDGRRAMPFWSTEARVKRLISTVPSYAGFEPESIPLKTWRDRWLPGLRRDSLLVGLNWTGARATGYDLEPASVVDRLALAERPGPTARQ
ncbi:hypothetical protein GCM10009872_44180 [Actinopolymorpha rutila]